jgi:hypothetical protein
MTFVYIVRCNFTEPEKEQAWNAWYSGPKIAQMLAKPHFRTCQRFRLVSGTGRNYLALWTVQSPQAFHTPEYASDWGFFEWRSCICDWSRDLFDAGGASENAFAVTPAGALHVVSFDAMCADEASAARRVIAPSQPHLIWLPVVGLDRHSPIVGLAPLSDLPSARASPQVRDVRVQEAIYRPICDLCRTASASECPLPQA